MTAEFVILGDPELSLDDVASVMSGAGFTAGANDWDCAEPVVFAVSVAVGITPGFAQAVESGQGRSVRPAAIWFYDQEPEMDPDMLELAELESRAVIAAIIGEDLAESLPCLGPHQMDWVEKLRAALQGAGETRELQGLDKAILKKKRVKDLVKEPKKSKQKKAWWKFW
ncbi:MAG: hypothetical protein ABI333_09345 [bacterium]